MSCEYKVGYVDLRYQNRQIITAMKKYPHGSVKMVRAALEAKGKHEYDAQKSLRYVSITEQQFNDFDPLAESEFAEDLLPSKGNLQNSELHADMMNAVTVKYFPYPVIIRKYLLGVEIPTPKQFVPQIVLTDLTDEQRAIVDRWFTDASNHAEQWVRVN